MIKKILFISVIICSVLLFGIWGLESRSDQNQPPEQITKLRSRQITQSIEFFLKLGNSITALESLKELASSKFEGGPFIKPIYLIDGWGNLFEIANRSSSTLMIRSAGKDGEFGSDDDLQYRISAADCPKEGEIGNSAC